MIQKASLHVLAEAAEIGLPEAATVPAAAFDPVLRPFIKRRVRRAVEEAAAKVAERTPGDHVLRLAFLFALASPVPDPNDGTAIAKAFETAAEPFLPKREVKPRKPEHEGGAYRVSPGARAGDDLFPTPPKRAKRFWPITTPALLGLLAIGVSLACVLVLPSLIPTPMRRFQRTPLGTALGEPLTDVIVAGSRGASPETRARVLAEPVRKQLGADGMAHLERIVDLVPDVAKSPAPTTDEAMAPLFEAVNAANASFETQKLPAILHGYATGTSAGRAVWVTSWFVERREEVSVDGQPLRVAWGRRLDGLNIADSSIYKANAEDWSVLSVDLAEQELVETLLRPIAKGGAMGPDELRDADHSARAELLRAATPKIAAEVTKAGKVSQSDVEGLWRAIAQRNELVISLSKAGYRVTPSSRIEVSQALAKSLERSAESNPSDRALIDDFLSANSRAAGYRRDVAGAVAILARSIESQFAVRLVDDKRLASSTAKALEPIAPRARGVASSWMAALAAGDDPAPTLTLFRVAHPTLFSESDSDPALARFVLDALLLELGLAGADALADDEAYDRALAAAFALPPARVHAAAAAAYPKLFGKPAPAIAIKAR